MTQATSHIRSGAAELPVARDFAHWIKGRWVNGEGDAFARAKAAFDSGCWSDLSGEDRR